MNRTNINTLWTRCTAWIAVVLLVGLLLSGCGSAGAKGPVPCVTGAELVAIENQTELKEIAENPNGNYCLKSSIALKGNWVPLDTFTGTLDGRGYTISGLTINEESVDTVGFFRELGAGAIVKDLSFDTPNVKGQEYTGVLAGKSSSTATAITVIENINIIGGSVKGTEHVGGLVGSNSGTIENSYAASIVEGTAKVGGLVGENAGEIKNSYATGTASISTSAGGLVGENKNQALISNSYYDSTRTGQTKGIGTGANNQAGNVIGVSAAASIELNANGKYYDNGGTPNATEIFVDWDFTSTWKWRGNGEWPILAWQ